MVYGKNRKSLKNLEKGQKNRKKLYYQVGVKKNGSLRDLEMGKVS
jgi:hypothetical protein